MEFDKSKILTVVTADQAKVGQKGWFADELCTLMRMVKNCTPMTVEQVGVESACRRFMTDQGIPFALFYPVPEPTYSERQAEWVKKNNVKVGTKVRFTKGFEDSADGSDCCEHRDAKGKEGFVNEIFRAYLCVVVEGDYWVCPFTALEIINEPTYGERQEEWIKKHNLKEGDKVKILRTAKDGEDGWNNQWTESMSRLVGSVFTYYIAYQSGISLSCGYNWPYFVLEVVKEPTYRPFNEDELNDLVGKIVRNKQTRYRKLVTGKPTTSLGVNIEGKYINAKDLLNSFMMDDGKSPCGIKEEV